MPGDDSTSVDPSAPVTVRQARAGDADAVASFTRDTWDEFERGDYVPDVFPEWVASDGSEQRTLVAERDDAVVGCCQVVLLSPWEAWAQGMRVHTAHRGTGVGRALDQACAAWSRERGAAVLRHMVFSWNEAGLRAARTFEYRPRAEFRWALLEPDPVAGSGDQFPVSDDPDAAWAYWGCSEARDALGGMALDPAESWALSTWTRQRTRRAAGETALFAVQRDGTRATTWRTRVADAGDDERRAEYGAAAWDDLESVRALFDAVRADAAAVDADRARVLIPETPRHVADAAAAGADLGDHPDLVFEADLSAREG